MNKGKSIIGASAILVLAAGAALASAQQTPSPQTPVAQSASRQTSITLPVDTTTSYKGEEFLLIGNPTRGAGEPLIAINPKNPNNIIVGAMANSNYVEGVPMTAPGQPRVGGNATLKYKNTYRASISMFAISDDRGRTWRYMDDPFLDVFKMNTAADTSVGAGPDGTLYIGAMDFFPQNPTPAMLELEVEPNPGLLFGWIDIASSYDEGKTWSTPAHVMGQATHPMEYGPGVKPVFRGKTPYDRPFIEADMSTGAIYVPGHGSGGDPPHAETFFRASRDNGKTWTPVYTADSAEYPSARGGSKPRAANGVLAFAYVASSAPASTGAKCPCLVFETSRDDGKTFDRRIAKADFTTQERFGQLAADPSHPGRFAIMTLVASGSEMQVYLTDDYGKTWKNPVHAGGTPGTMVSKPDMNYSPKGELALMWLAVKPDQTYTCWSSASHDGGNSFSKGIQVSHSPSPARSSIKDRGNNRDGDDLSSLAVDDEYVHIVWADGRAGFLGAWYARVPLSSY
jgi:hypothetical protein